MTESALATTNTELQVFSGIAAFDAAQRMAKALSSSTLVPQEYRGQQGLANSLIALEMAGRMRLSPLVVMQNLSIIHGRPSWSSSFLIATVNASGRFTPLRFVFDNPAQPNSCYAVAADKATGEELVGEVITLEMAKREGWSTKNGSKWLTMPGQMLRYRAASFWARVYCPEVSLGLVTQEEAIDVEPVAVTVGAPESHPALAPEPELAPASDPEPEPAPKPAPEPQPEQPEAEPDTPVEVEAEVVEQQQAPIAAALDRVAQLQTLREVEAGRTWAGEHLQGDDLERMQTALQNRERFLRSPLTVAARQTAVAALNADADLQARFREAFGVAADAPLPSSITQRQHQEWLNAQRN